MVPCFRVVVRCRSFDNDNNDNNTTTPQLTDIRGMVSAPRRFRTIHNMIKPCFGNKEVYNALSEISWPTACLSCTFDGRQTCNCTNDTPLQPAVCVLTNEIMKEEDGHIFGHSSVCCGGTLACGTTSPSGMRRGLGTTDEITWMFVQLHGLIYIRKMHSASVTRWKACLSCSPQLQCVRTSPPKPSGRYLSPTCSFCHRVSPLAGLFPSPRQFAHA